MQRNQYCIYSVRSSGDFCLIEQQLFYKLIPTNIGLVEGYYVHSGSLTSRFVMLLFKFNHFI